MAGDIETQNVRTDKQFAKAESEKVSVAYYPLSISVFSCFPQIVTKGVKIDGTYI